MKLKLMLAAAALALLGAGSARADITINFASTTPIDPTANYAVAGSFTNTSGGGVTIDGGSFTVPAGVGVIDNFTDLTFTDLPMTMKANDFYSLDPWLEFKIPAGFPGGSGTYFLDSGATVVGSGTFRLPGSAVPEPGSVALLMGSMITGGMFLVRRRK